MKFKTNSTELLLSVLIGKKITFCYFYKQKNTEICGANLEPDVVADQDVSLHEVPLVLTVFSDHGEGVIDGGPQDADQRLDSGVRVHVGEVGLHDIAGGQP